MQLGSLAVLILEIPGDFQCVFTIEIPPNHVTVLMQIRGDKKLSTAVTTEHITPPGTYTGCPVYSVSGVYCVTSIVVNGEFQI